MAVKHIPTKEVHKGIKGGKTACVFILVIIQAIG